MPDTFRPPYRITTLFDRLSAKAELHDCQISIEEYPSEQDAGYFPRLQFDTSRVYVRFKDYSVNVAGCIEDGQFHYRINGYAGEEPWGDGNWGTYDGVDKVVDLVVEKMLSIPREAPGEPVQR